VHLDHHSSPYGHACSTRPTAVLLPRVPLSPPQSSHQNWWINQQLADKKEGSSYVTEIDWKSMSACLEGRIPDAWDKAGFKAAQALRDNDPHQKVPHRRASHTARTHACTHASVLAYGETLPSPAWSHATRMPRD